MYIADDIDIGCVSKEMKVSASYCDCYQLNGCLESVNNTFRVKAKEAYIYMFSYSESPVSSTDSYDIDYDKKSVEQLITQVNAHGDLLFINTRWGS